MAALMTNELPALVPVRRRDQCRFCTSRSCYTAIYTEDRTFDEVACSRHIRALELHADAVLGSPGKLRTNLSSTGRQSRERLN